MLKCGCVHQRFKLHFSPIVYYESIFHIFIANIPSHYHVVVILLPKNLEITDLPSPDDRYDSLVELKAYNQELCNMEQTSPKAYITAEFGQESFPSDRSFVVGMPEVGLNSPNDPDRNYPNGLLCYGAKYTFFVRGYSGSASSVSHACEVLLLSSPFIFVVVVVVVGGWVGAVSSIIKQVLVLGTQVGMKGQEGIYP